jgi:hypothetical protein
MREHKKRKTSITDGFSHQLMPIFKKVYIMLYERKRNGLRELMNRHLHDLNFPTFEQSKLLPYIKVEIDR